MMDATRRKQERVTKVALSIIDLLNQKGLALDDRHTILGIAQKLLCLEPPDLSPAKEKDG